MTRIVASIMHPHFSLRIYSSSSFPSPPPPHPFPSLPPPPLYRNATHYMEKTNRRYLMKPAPVLALLPRPPPLRPSVPARLTTKDAFRRFAAGGRGLASI